MFSPLTVKSRSDGKKNTLISPKQHPRVRGLQALKGHNSFKNCSFDSPVRSPEKASFDESATPLKRLNSTSTVNRKLMIETSDDEIDDVDMLSPSPITSYHHKYKGRIEIPENKAYKYSCSGEVTRIAVRSGNDSPHDRRVQAKKAKTSDKLVTYSAEYLRPIEEFIYPSLRPSKEEFERRRLEAKKRFDFSLPEDESDACEFDLRWKIEEKDSEIIRPDLSGSVLHNISDKGEATLRAKMATNQRIRLRAEEEAKYKEDLIREEKKRLLKEKGFPVVSRKSRILGNLFNDANENVNEEIENDDADSDTLYYNLSVKHVKQRQNRSDRLAALMMIKRSHIENLYESSKTSIETAVPGMDERNDHFKGLMSYQIRKSMSEQKMNNLLTKNAATPASKRFSCANFDVMEEVGEAVERLNSDTQKGEVKNTSSIANRQKQFQKQRSVSSFECLDPEDEERQRQEHAKMCSALPPVVLNSQYSSNSLSRIKQASQLLAKNMGTYPLDLDDNNVECDFSIDSDSFMLSWAEQKKRVAQDSLLFREIRAGLIPEQLLKKIPRMGSMVALDISYFSIGDELCQCLAKSLAELDILHTMGLRANRLTFVSLNSIFTHVNVKKLQHLDVSLNDMSGSSVSTLCDMMKRKECKLSSLELENTNLNRKDVYEICRSIISPTTSWMMELSLSRNGLDGRTMPAIVEVIKYPGCSLSWLDLSWNSFDSDSASSLADALAINKTLISIDLSANSLRDAGGQRIAACLLRNRNLQEIYLSLNNIGGKSCFIFSKVLRNHPSMKRLNLSDNPLTEAGARSIFRTILRGLKCFVMMQNCTFNNETGLFNHSNPSIDSPYTLDLSEPYHVSVLSELIQMVNLNKTCRFGHITYREKASDSKHTDISAEVVNGETYLCNGSIPWAIPAKGMLKLHLTHRPRIPTVDMAIDELAFNTIVAIVVNARSENDRRNWLFLMCMDAYFTTMQAQDLIDILEGHHLVGGGGISIVEFFYCLWSNLIDVVNVYDFYHRNLDSTKKLSLIHSLSFEKFRFNWVNPSGHWRLDLSNKVQRSVMMQLIALNLSESKASKRARRGDTSQKGNYCNFRNEKLADEEVEVNIDFTKSLPWTGVLEFDYITTTRPPPEAEIISDEDFSTLMQDLDLSTRRRLSSKNSNLKLMELQLAVTKFCFSPERILNILACFSEDNKTQVGVIVCMFGRLVDLHNFDIILRHINGTAIQSVLNKIGVLNCLNPLKPCLDLRLNLKYVDNRILVHCYLQLSSAEGGDQLKQHPRSEVDIIALYAAMGRLISDPVDGALMFTYCEVGEREAPLDWKLRKDAIQLFLLGNPPRHPQLLKPIQWYKEIKNAGLLSLGPLDIQYANYRKEKALKTFKGQPKVMGKASAALKSAAATARMAVAVNRDPNATE